MVYQWDPATGEFVRISDPFSDRYLDNWEQVRAILGGRKTAATHNELLTDCGGCWANKR